LPSAQVTSAVYDPLPFLATRQRTLEVPMRIRALLTFVGWTLLSAHGLVPSAQSTWYVNPDCGDDAWTGVDPACLAPDGPKRTIAAAMTIAETGDEVILADGTYRGSGNKWLSFPGRYFTVRSANGPASCIIDLESSGLAFFLVTDETPQAVVQGLTIQNGSSGEGGAFFIHHESQVVIRDCVLRDNFCSSSGGAIHCDTNASPTILNCAIVGNTALGAGGGMACFTGGSSPRVLGCLVAGNSAGLDGGGLYFGGFGDAPQVVNSTIADNTSSAAIGGVFVNASSGVTLANSILWGNSGAAIGGPGSPLVSFSDVQGGWPGAGNIDADPRFRAGSYRLLRLSPSIEAGDNAALPVELVRDLDGGPRVSDADLDGLALVDQGAYEFALRVTRF
jgi:predicted outer membrane repeat protein